MLVVNLYGGPGCGKSTTAAGVFSQLKLRGYNAELVTEYAKDMVWEKRQAVFDNQIYIFGKQHHRLWRLRDQVDVVVTDSPLLLSLIYNVDKNDIGKSLDSLVLNTYKYFNNMNFLLKRRNGYDPRGRHQTEAEAIAIDDDIRLALEQHSIPYILVPGISDTITEITDMVEMNLDELG